MLLLLSLLLFTSTVLAILPLGGNEPRAYDDPTAGAPAPTTGAPAPTTCAPQHRKTESIVGSQGEKRLLRVLRNSSTSRLPADFHALRQFITTFSRTSRHSKQLTGRAQFAQPAQDNQPWVWTSTPTETNISVVMCLQTKAGSSAWLKLFDRAEGLSKWRSRISMFRYRSDLKLIRDQRDALDDPCLLRIMLVRNPYSRLLSTPKRVEPDPHLPMRFHLAYCCGLRAFDFRRGRRLPG